MGSSLVRKLLGLFGWRVVVEEEPPKTGSVMVAAPHTSNWDLILMFGLAWSTGVRVKWLGKKEIFRGPFGPLMKALGGVPVPRGKAGGMVEDLSASLKKRSAKAERHPWALALAPKGTRSKRDYWKSGFYRIAQSSDLPLALGFVDAKTKTIGFGPVVPVTGDVAADMDKIRDFYADKQGIRAEKQSVPRLRMEETGLD